VPYPSYEVTFVAGTTKVSFTPNDPAIRGTHAFVLSVNGGAGSVAVTFNVNMTHSNEGEDLIPKLIVTITDAP
jgi:hypothetical protein